jgi:hypothetical protein
MGALWGRPDFGAKQAATAFEVYRSYEPGPYLVWPTGLDVALLAPGRPDLEIVFTRSSGAGPDSGLFHFGIEQQEPLEDALSFLRRIDPQATVQPVPFESGFIRLVVASDLMSIPPDLVQPVPLGWGGIKATRCDIPLSADSASILKASLTGTLNVSARAEVEVLGVAPRVAATVVFDPAALLAPLIAAGGSTRLIPRTALDDYFLHAPGSLPLTLEGDPNVDTASFAAAMAGRVRMQFGTLVPSPSSEGSAYLQLAANIPSGTFRWDLSEPMAVLRPFVFILDPFEAARNLAKADGAADLYREVTTARPPFGFFDIDVAAFLPPVRLGLADLGVMIEAPARPPYRPQAVSLPPVSFQPPDDHAVVHLHLSPLETLHYVTRTWADVIASGIPHHLLSDPVARTEAMIRFQAQDFPISFIELSADPALLALANLSGAVRYPAHSGAEVSVSFTLTTASQRASVVLPRDAVGATVSVDALPVATGGAPASAPLTLGPWPASAQHFTLGSFAEFGAHNVVVACSFDAGSIGTYAVDLVADGQPESNIVTFYLTRDGATAHWTYIAESPFAAGYRWRVHPAGPWSKSAGPGTPLQLAAPLGPVVKPAVWDLRGVHLYASPGDPPGLVRYVPGEPVPQLDDRGRPALQFLDTGAAAVLSLGTRLEVTDSQRADLEVDLLEKLEGVDRIDFQPAAFTVGPVTLSLGDGTGLYQPLATASSVGAPPYATTFSVKLSGDQITRALAALGGAPGICKVDYPLTLSPEVASTFDGAPAALVRSTDVATWFPDGSGNAHIARVSG